MQEHLVGHMRGVWRGGGRKREVAPEQRRTHPMSVLGMDGTGVSPSAASGGRGSGSSPSCIDSGGG